VEYTKNAKPKQEKETLKFGATTSDHMLEVRQHSNHTSNAQKHRNE
jgi:hypothetical protein